jgi:hypothetical protein
MHQSEQHQGKRPAGPLNESNLPELCPRSTLVGWEGCSDYASNESGTEATRPERAHWFSVRHGWHGT